ncbi:MutS2 protein [uncultured delta proteobacterium]|uniref:Endonuclease MutS2 n=1 Tax=uncultured delta proteobacterium TaxID=34034 RepID=A0A212J3E7_9DELT|nr:MutS2 protein [uncultured delta proteobacterium]
MCATFWQPADSMDSRALTLLELPKVLGYLAEKAVSEAGKAACLALRPQNEVAAVRKAGAWFAQGRIWKAKTGFILPAFLSLDGVLAYLESPLALLDIDALWGLRQTLVPAKELLASLEETDAPDGESQWPLLAERARSFAFPHQSIAALVRCLADDGRLRDEASPELLLARGGIRSLHQTCARRVREFIQQNNLEQFLQDDFMTLSSDRYVLPLKTNFKGRLQGVIHDYSQTGETCYFEPVFLMEVNNRLQELKQEEREAEIKVLQYLTGLIQGELPAIRDVYALLTDMDVTLAAAALADVYGGVAVEFGEEEPVALHNACHPLLFLQHKAGPKTSPSPIPVDILLKREQRALIISGGNAGGKTVSLKTLGLTALMGMCGLPVPVAPGSTLPLWRDMHVFIGDEQSLEDHVSTFTAQIRNLSKAWDAVGAHSLVILDEFGAGTDPAQGAALAQAVVDGLLDAGAYVLAATHFPALKAYALSREGVRAASVLFDPKSKKPLFRLAYDQVGASQALDVAKEHGLPDPILRRAEQYLLLDGADTSSLIDRLNALAVEREKELSGLEAERKKLHDKRTRLDEKFAKEREELFGRIQADAQHVLREWKMSRISHKQALKELSKARKDLLAEAGAAQPQEVPAAQGASASEYFPGMTVRYTAWDKNGTVLEVDSRRKKVRLDLSGVTVWVDMADCVPTQAKERSAGVPHVPAQAAPGKYASGNSVRLDLRGMRADIAITELERFLDAAIMNGRTELEILHGRGTGALRREVHAFLKNYPPAASFAVAPEDQGGDGVTCIVLK